MNRPAKLIKSRLITTTALAILIIGMAGSRFPVSAQSKDEEGVRRALLDNAAGFERNDLDALNRVWGQDESVTVFENGFANYGWADYRDNHLKPEMAEMKNVKYALTDIQPRIAGNTAWATFKYTISADVKERHVEGGGLGTAILEKREGRWQIVHWHTSNSRRAPASQSPPKKN